MNDQIYRQAAIDACIRVREHRAYDEIEEIKALPSAQSDLTYIIFETLAECGIYGEEATIKLIGTLKRLGRSDLLPPCTR